MLNQFEFQDWCKSLCLDETTIEHIEKIRKSPPSRSVRSGSKSVSGRYSSIKMGMTIQYESHTVELPAIYSMEHEESILEYYDQPITLKLNYTKSNGRKIGFYYTPDFLVLTKDNAYLEEWKTEEQLVKLNEKDPNRYFKDTKDIWRCPPGEEAAASYGLNFRIRSSKEIDVNLYRNIVFLEDYLKTSNYKVLKQNGLEIKSIVTSNLGISMDDLIQSLSLATVDDIYALIVQKEIYVDLESHILSQSKDVPVYINKSYSDANKPLKINNPENICAVSSLTIAVNSVFIWDGIQWKIVNNGINSITLQSDDNEILELPKVYFLELFNKGRIKPINEHMGNSYKTRWENEIHKAGPKDLEIANTRFEVVQRKLKGEYISSSIVPSRTLRRWMKNYKDAQKLFGNGYLGLLPNYKDRGNRNIKLPEEVKVIMDKVIEEDYYTLKQKNKFAVFTKLVHICEESDLIIPSYQTFCRTINNKSKFKETLERKGHKAAYQNEELYWYLDNSIPRHGDRPFEIAHIDHTELDIELVCSKTGKNLGRPWLTFLIDGYSRLICSFHITFDSPSYRSLMVTLRECVRKHNRLPQTIVVDGGKEFHSVYFDTLLATFELNKKVRPPAKARFGSIIERVFGTTNSSFLYYLQGNTQGTKNVRTITKKTDPKNHAVWTLETLNGALEKWLTELYSKNVHPALDGQTPQEAFERGLQFSGKRNFKLIPYDKNFIIATMPSTRKGNVKINSRTGVKVNYVNYWNAVFKSVLLDGESVPVRYDPFDISIVYVYVNNQWVTCKSEYYYEFKGKTEKELKLATEEIRKRRGNQAKNYVINASRIAQFFNDMELKEKTMMAKMRSQSLQSILKGHKDVFSSDLEENENLFTNNGSPNFSVKDIPIQSFNVYQKEAE